MPIRTRAVFVLASLLAACLAALPARAVTVEFFASDFLSSPGGAPVAGTVTGSFSADDANADGIISASEVLAFSFATDFADPALDFAGDQTGFSLFALVPPAAPAPLTAGLGWEGFGLLGIAPLGGSPVGDLTLLLLTPTEAVVARMSPSMTVAMSGPPEITVVPLAASLPMMLVVLGFFGFFAWRRHLSSPGRRVAAG